MLPDSTRAAAQARRRRWWASSVRHHLRGEPRAGAVPAPPRAPSGRIQATAPGSRSRRARPGSSSSWPACSCLSDRQQVAAALEDARALLLTARNSSAPSLPAEGRTLHARLRPTPTRRGLRAIAPSARRTTTHGGRLRAAAPGDGHERKSNKIAIAVRAPHGHMENKENDR